MLSDAAAFYFSLTPGPRRLPIYVDEKTIVYVRVELHRNVASLTEALDNARPQSGETLMNTHYITKGA